RCKSYYANNKLYIVGFLNDDFYYIDLSNISLNENTFINLSKWIKINVPNDTNDILSSGWPFLGGTWARNLSFTGTPSQYFLYFRPWISNKYNGKAYSPQDISKVVDILDTINFLWSNSASIPQIYNSYVNVTLYGPPQVLLSSNKILYFSEYLGDKSNLMTLMTSILEYDITNTSGAVPSQRNEFTAVSTSDGRVIIYGGTRNMLAATPSLVVLNTSNYEWSVPSEINHVGPLYQHSSIMINNYMLVAC
ncbi:7599_t:CDS:2, partial [Racocetra persica]